MRGAVILVSVVACVAPSEQERTCADARTDDARALCDACAGDPACIGFLGDPERLRCGGTTGSSSIVWAIDAGTCVVPAPPDPPECPPPTEQILAPWSAPFTVNGAWPYPALGAYSETEASLALDGGLGRSAELSEHLYAILEEQLDLLPEPEPGPDPRSDRPLSDPGWRTPDLVIDELAEGRKARSVIERDDVFDVAPKNPYDPYDSCCTETTMVDVYVDHEEHLLATDRGYRLRLQFGNAADELAYEAALALGEPVAVGDLPTEMQFQARTPAAGVGVPEGVDTVTEYTLWFLPGRPPFEPEPDSAGCDGEAIDCFLPLPEQPWRPDEWLDALMSGRVDIDGATFLPLPAEYVAGVLPEGATLRPVVVVVSTRRRFDVLLRHPEVFIDDCEEQPAHETAPWACVPYARPVYLVSVDETEVLPAEPWLAHMRGEGPGQRPLVLTRFAEVEVEILRPSEIEPGSPLGEALAEDHLRVIGIVSGALAAALAGPRTEELPKYERAAAAGFVRGDADGSGFVDGADGLALLAAVTAAGPVPAAGDLDLDADVDRDDVQRLIEYLWLGAPPPAAPWPDPAIPCSDPS